MIRTFTGENSFELQRELRAVTDAFVAEQGDLALERIDGQEASFDRIQEAVTSLPFLASKKLVLLRAPSANKQFVEKFESLLADIPETTDLIIVEPKLDKRLSYYKFLKKQTDFYDFPPMDANSLSRWLVDTAKQQGGLISVSDAHYLVERVGASQQLVSSDLEKLLLYDANVTRKTIDLLTEATPQSTIFQLLESAFAGNDKRALELYAEQRALKVEPQQIIAMLAWQLHVLAIIKAAGDRSADVVAKEAKLNPYVVRKSQGIARKITIAELKTLVSDLLTIDARSKRTALDLDEALQHYLLKLAN
ncbi:MAG: polymerase subunit delta [Candidatus Saccharibacteria bacterium]|nr:polymerase subunit delta [Candidatus Saccharibacteria bacterium]